MNNNGFIGRALAAKEALKEAKKAEALAAKEAKKAVKKSK